MRVTLVCFVALVSFGAAGSASAQYQYSDFELVGFTSATFPGTEGILSYSQACGAEFSNSRMCQTLEIANTVDVPAGLSGSAWVRGVRVGAAQHDTLMHYGVGDCRDWSELNSDGGLVVDAQGRFSNETCASLYSVACCAEPVSIMASVLPVSSPFGQLVLAVVLLGGVSMMRTARTAPEE